MALASTKITELDATTAKPPVTNAPTIANNFFNN
jgi:hypothetical protein